MEQLGDAIYRYLQQENRQIFRYPPSFRPALRREQLTTRLIEVYLHWRESGFDLNVGEYRALLQRAIDNPLPTRRAFHALPSIEEEIAVLSREDAKTSVDLSRYEVLLRRALPGVMRRWRAT